MEGRSFQLLKGSSIGDEPFKYFDLQLAQYYFFLSIYQEPHQKIKVLHPTSRLGSFSGMSICITWQPIALASRLPPRLLEAVVPYFPPISFLSTYEETTPLGEKQLTKCTWSTKVYGDVQIFRREMLSFRIDCLKYYISQSFFS